MRIYKLFSDCNGHKCLIRGHNSRELIKLLNSDDVLNRKYEINVVVDSEFGNGKLLDFNLAELPMISQKAYKTLKPYIENEMLEPVKCKWKDGVLHGWEYGIRLKRIDCINLNESHYKEMSGWLMFSQYIFDTYKLQNTYLFKIPGENSVFCTSQFYELVHDKELTGFKFYPVFDDQNNVVINCNYDAGQLDKSTVYEIDDVKLKRELNDNYAYGMRILNIKNEGSDYIVERINEILDDPKRIKRIAKMNHNDITGIAIGLAVLWAELICAKYQWKWCRIACDGEGLDRSLICIVAPDESFYIDPINLFNDICSNKKNNDSLLLFNMLGNLKKYTKTTGIIKLE